jgi:Heparinase II/III-like protein/Domain of unknown function (DUF4962)
MKFTQLTIPTLLAFCLLFTLGCKKGTPVTPTVQKVQILSTLKPEHPRITFTNTRLEELKKLRTTDATLDKYINAVISTANTLSTKPMLTRVLLGPRLLDVSRELFDRVSHLALAYHFTNDKKYLDAAVNNMKAVCEFSDWNPSHFLDVAEMTNGVAVGYDWLYNVLSPKDRNIIREGIKKHGLEEYKKRSTEWWNTSENNWNQVCNGSLIVASLAIAETDPSYAKDMIPKALENLSLSTKFYAPDGAWYEGPVYWSYATEYLTYGMSALNTALGNMGGLEKNGGLATTGLVPMICAGPTNYLLNFADADENSKATTSAAMFFLSKIYDNAQICNYLHNLIKTDNALATPFHIIWYKAPATPTNTPPLDHYLNGDINELVFMRSSWTDPNALWVGIKSGTNGSNHSHLDLGNFELDAGGVRWAKDLGADDYDLNGYFSRELTGQRWNYYRLNSFSHNVPLLGKKGQYPLAKARFIQKDLNTAAPSATVDLTEAYKDFASKSTRKISLVDSRKAFLIEDNFTLTKTTEVAWGMMTANSLEILRGGKANVRNSLITSRWLEAEIISPAGAEFTEESAIQKAPEKTNVGNTRLMIRLPNQSGTVKIVVKLTPKG